MSLPDRELLRTSRHLSLPGFGLDQQEALFNASVLVVGAGGLGCPIIQQLAAAGVGSMEIWDDDTVDVSNIHRQILFGAEDVGKPKATLAAQRAQELMPDGTAHGIQQRLHRGNILTTVQGVDLVIDGSDNFATKYLVADACEITGTPLVWGTVLRYHGDVAVWHSGTTNRKANRRKADSREAENRGVGLRDLFPEQLPSHAVPDCATAGVLGVTTSVVGGLMATLAIGWLTGLEREVGVVHSYDAFPARLRSYRISADPDRALVTHLGDYGDGNREQLRALIAAGAPVVDIREVEEGPSPSGVLRVPLSTISTSADLVAALDQAVGDVIVVCASGARAARLVARFQADSEPTAITFHAYPGGITEIDS